MAGLAIAAAIGCMTLPETLNQPTMESLYSDQSEPNKGADENRNEVDPENGEETVALMWKRSSTGTNKKVNASSNRCALLLAVSCVQETRAVVIFL